MDAKMDAKVVKLVLDRPALKGGGDRYKAVGRDDFTNYYPQDFTRVNGKPKKSLKITIEDGDDEVAV